ncbi:hypothetical protein DI005_35635 [Prauserella sp. PE36]|uniref:Uncharacterized protein n=1 Tax=Prauserella endophytica TaxID=1592324 RepID=A0ABY2RUC5_9PSEU|nr:MULTISPECIES: hypothetical protein [Prauserella]RBM10535.1 hypothetical protein DI005_35635 [Prauserella sp. PE36]TKG58713.1 hypothetical protein FCN18_37625 [Prauserella endophytica]
MTSQTAAGSVQAAPAVSRPGTLLAAIVVAVAGGLATVVNGILMATGGDDLAIDILASALGEPAESIRAAGADFVVAEVADTLSGRGTMALAFGGGLLVFGLLLARAALWARILVTIFALLTVLIAGRVVTDDGTGTLIALGVAGLLCALVTIVLAWLPANGRYAKALKNAR